MITITRLWWWYNGVDPDRPGGPWWYMDFDSEKDVKSRIELLKPFVKKIYGIDVPIDLVHCLPATPPVHATIVYEMKE